jgi:hypothetical protein
MKEGRFTELVLEYLSTWCENENDRDVWDTLERVERHTLLIAIENSLEKIFNEYQEGT